MAPHSTHRSALSSGMAQRTVRTPRTVSQGRHECRRCKATPQHATPRMALHGYNPLTCVLPACADMRACTCARVPACAHLHALTCPACIRLACIRPAPRCAASDDGGHVYLVGGWDDSEEEAIDSVERMSLWHDTTLDRSRARGAATSRLAWSTAMGSGAADSGGSGAVAASHFGSGESSAGGSAGGSADAHSGSSDGGGGSDDDGSDDGGSGGDDGAHIDSRSDSDSDGDGADGEDGEDAEGGGGEGGYDASEHADGVGVASAHSVPGAAGVSGAATHSKLLEDPGHSLRRRVLWRSGGWDAMGCTRTLPEGRCFAAATCDSSGDLWVLGGGDAMSRGADCYRSVLRFQQDHAGDEAAGEDARDDGGAAAAAQGAKAGVVPAIGRGRFQGGALEEAGSATGEWHTMGQLLEPRCGLALAADLRSSLLYLCGGYSGGLEYADSVETFDMAGVAPSMRLPPMAFARSGCGAGMGPDGALYVVGGSCDGSTMLSSCERYDPREGLWHALPELPTPRGYLAAAFSPSGLLYASGGCSPSGHPLNTLEAFDRSAGKWRAMPPLPSPRSNHAIVLALAPHCA